MCLGSMLLSEQVKTLAKCCSLKIPALCDIYKVIELYWPEAWIMYSMRDIAVKDSIKARSIVIVP